MLQQNQLAMTQRLDFRIIPVSNLTGLETQ